ncbi:snare-complex protein syntaxin-18 N-terminus-domain-containing protein [Sporodiniella umbellata]|nr:snare-complex protein syntaxin-18 N-terminus-domain-containing protein [Sporodiniella umbellata]
MSINLTHEFRQLAEQKASTQKPSYKKKKSMPKKQPDLFTEEAYRIYQHIASLKRFLIAIRPIYLSTGKHTKTDTVRFSHQEDPLFQFLPTQIDRLSDQERDEIDFQAKWIIKQSMSRIKELEQSQTIEPTKGVWSWLLSTLNEDVIRVHQSSMTWLLNQQLMKVSRIQKEQQHIRLTREIEKSENQLSRLPTQVTTSEEPPTIELDAFETMLSKEQLQVLEKENSVMLEGLNNTLNQIKSAEQALLEISTLQTQLTNHLAAQTVQTDRLYADALATTDTVSRGNTQLLTAKERNRGSRKFMLFFLIGASFVLLFLDWYS